MEGYPGLVVHGPLMATWLMNFADALFEDRTLARLAFRVQAPVFVDETISLLARESDDGLELAVANGRALRVISASAELKAR